MTTRRSKFELCSDILRAMDDGVSTPTQLCYRANISWSVLYDILNTLIKENYVAVEDNGKRKSYKLTEEGVKAERTMEKVTESLGAIVSSRNTGISSSFVSLGA